VVNAIYVWGLARAHHGSVLLRIEDHDRQRSRPEYEAAILEDIEWLGFAPDEGRHPVLRQSDQPDAYARALDRLRRAHHVYACGCSRKAIGGERYDGRCRAEGLAEASGRGLRVQLEAADETFTDLRLGTVTQTPSLQCGDLLLRDRDGQWTYQFAVTVDDCRQDITHVIRGEDLLGSTGRQIALARMLGREEPAAFFHHPLLMNGEEKLSKSRGDTGVRELRDAGVSPAEVIGRAAHAVGLIDRMRPVSAIDVAALFADRRD
jgi:glutamyl-tRNA synthetase/glutamyl-Q tRNA(Asp) synthetase